MGRRFTERVVSPPADSSPPIARRLRGAEGSALMAFASMSCVQLALALSVHVFSLLGPLGVAALRLAWAGLLLLILVRPRPRDFTRQDLDRKSVV